MLNINLPNGLLCLVLSKSFISIADFINGFLILIRFKDVLYYNIYHFWWCTNIVEDQVKYCFSTSR